MAKEKSKTIILDLGEKELKAFKDFLLKEKTTKKDDTSNFQTVVSLYKKLDDLYEHQRTELVTKHSLEIFSLIEPLGFGNPESKRISVKSDDSYAIPEKLKVLAENVIAVVSATKGRAKRIFVRDIDNPEKIKSYILNSNKLNNQKLIEHLDQPNHYLLQISGNTIVNVKYYELNGSKVVCILRPLPPDEFKKDSPNLFKENIFEEKEKRKSVLEKFNKITENIRINDRIITKMTETLHKR